MPSGDSVDHLVHQSKAVQDRHQESQMEPFKTVLHRTGHDEVNIHGVKEHESYRGDRTQTSLLAFADNLVPSAGQAHHYIRYSLQSRHACKTHLRAALPAATNGSSCRFHIGVDQKGCVKQGQTWEAGLGATLAQLFLPVRKL